MDLPRGEDRTEASIKACLRGLATLTPATGVLGQLWSEWESRQKDERLQGFLRDVAERLAAYDAKIKALEPHLKRTSEFADLLERTTRNVMRETSSIKRAAAAKALTHCILAGPALSYEDKRNILENLDSLLDEDIELLWRIGRSQSVEKVGHFLDPFVKTAPLNSPQVAENVGAVVARIAKLEARGLIAHMEASSSMPVPKNVPPWAKSYVDKYYFLIPAGKKLLNAISDAERKARNGARQRLNR